MKIKLHQLQENLQSFSDIDGFSLKEIVKEFSKLKSQITYDLVRRIALKNFKNLISSNDGDFKLTVSQSSKLIKIISRAHNIDISTTIFKNYKDIIDNSAPPENNKTVLSVAINTINEMDIGKEGKTIEKPDYSGYWNYCGEEILIQDLHKDEYRNLDWREELKILLRQGLSSEDLKNIILDIEIEYHGIRAAAALLWVQSNPSEEFFIEAAKYSQASGFQKLEVDLYTALFKRNFGLIITLVLSIYHWDVFQEHPTGVKFIDIYQNPTFKDNYNTEDEDNLSVKISNDADKKYKISKKPFPTEDRNKVKNLTVTLEESLKMDKLPASVAKKSSSLKVRYIENLHKKSEF